MCVVKTQKVNGILINIHNDYIPQTKKEYKDNLKIVYDTINLIFQNKEKKNLFYTSQELENLKKQGEYEFLGGLI